MKNKAVSMWLAGGVAAAGVFLPEKILACACGCGVYDVGTSSMFPEDAGGTAFFGYTFQNQNKNWSGTSSAPGADNDDKKIRTETYTAGAQYFLDRDWGVQLQIPVVHRHFLSSENSGSINWTGLGDIQLRAVYTGFADDLSTGVSLGVKLPTGSHDHTDSAGEIERDVQIGSGSTDLLFGAFHRDSIGSSENWNWFVQAQLDLPVLKQGGYRPGLETDAAGGIYYEGLSLGNVKISPLAQIIGVWRGRDNGSDAAPDDTGYQKILVGPGIEFRLHSVKLYADVEFPIYENITGNQLVSPALFKVNLSYMF